MRGTNTICSFSGDSVGNYSIGVYEFVYKRPTVRVHRCNSKCNVCDGCTDEDCKYNACKDKCQLLTMNFIDVAKGEWYTEGVEYVYHYGMMEGVGDDLFDINGTANRAMIVTILWRLEGEPVYGQGKSGTFVDVAENTWYTEAIEWAAANEIVEGYGNDNFGPKDDITREQLAAILWRYAKYNNYDVSIGENTNILSYKDALDISDWALPAMQWACGTAIIKGDNEGSLLPANNALRSQMAIVFMRFCELKQ